MKKNKFVVTDNDKKLISKFSKVFYQAIFKLDDESLLLHYHDVLKELEKRGILCSKL